MTYTQSENSIIQQYLAGVISEEKLIRDLEPRVLNSLELGVLRVKKMDREYRPLNR